MTENTNIWLNGIMGVVVGDALGCPVQFESREEVARHPVTGMRGYGTFNLPEGSWTDDSSLTIALLESIRRVGEIDLDDIMGNFMKWLYDGEFTPYGESYDIGRGTMQAINRYKKNRKAKKCGGDEEWNNGNGSLMRIMPACLYCSVMESSGMYSDRDAIDVIHSVGGYILSAGLLTPISVRILHAGCTSSWQSIFCSEKVLFRKEYRKGSRKGLHFMNPISLTRRICITMTG